MPTSNPRINVTLSPSLADMVGRLSVLQRVSKAMVLRELLEAVEPQLLQAIALMELADGATAEARKRIAQDMEVTIKAAEANAALLQRQAANMQRDLVADAQSIQGRRPPRKAGSPASGGAGGVARKRIGPPSSNRGVKS